MALLPNGGFDAETVEPSQPLEAIPAGKYPMIILESEMKQTKAGDGSYLQMSAKIIEGKHQNRRMFIRFNLQNKNSQAVEIAYQQLSALCRAVGKMKITQSEVLHGIPFLGNVTFRPANGQFPASNDVNGFEPMNAQNLPQNQGHMAPTAPTVPTEPPAAPTAPTAPTAQVAPDGPVALTSPAEAPQKAPWE